MINHTKLCYVILRPYTKHENFVNQLRRTTRTKIINFISVNTGVDLEMKKRGP